MNHVVIWKNAGVLTAASIGGVLASLWGGWDGLMQVLLVMMAVDYIAGVAIAACGKSPKTESGHISSNAAITGLLKKGLSLLVVLVAAQIQTLVGGEFVRSTVILFFIGSEGISIVENAGMLGLPLPQAIVKIFEALRDDNAK